MATSFIALIKQTIMTSKLPRLSSLAHQSTTTKTKNDNNDLFTSSTIITATSTSTSTSTSTQKKNQRIIVSFSTVQVRQYNIMIGDNPSTRHGPSITYDWEYKEHKSIPIDQYEHIRQPQRRNNEEELFIPPNIREAILKKIGYTNDELEIMVQKDVDVIRKQRKKTMKEEIRKIRREKIRSKELLSKKRHSCCAL